MPKKKKKLKKRKKLKIKKRTRKTKLKTEKKIVLESEKELIIKTSKIWSKQAYVNKKAYEKKYNKSIKDNENFWKKEGKRITWIKPYTKIKDVKYSKTDVKIKWFYDGTLNASINCIDRHLKKKKNKTAIIWVGDNPEVSKNISYQELHRNVCRAANGLKSIGVKKGDRVTIYLTMIPELAFVMLACVRIGAIHSVVFGGFASNELASRIDDSKAKLLITASCGFEPGRTVEYKPLVDKALQLASHKLDKVILFQRPDHEVKLNPPKEISWDESLSNANDVDCVEINSNEFSYILYTSGTTGNPKGVFPFVIKYSCSNPHQYFPLADQ